MYQQLVMAKKHGKQQKNRNNKTKAKNEEEMKFFTIDGIRNGDIRNELNIFDMNQRLRNKVTNTKEEEVWKDQQNDDHRNRDK